MAVEFDEPVRELLDAPNFPVVSTLDDEGAPNSSVIWAAREGSTVLFVTPRHKRKGRNIERDPRVGLTVFDRTNPYRSLEVRGRAEFLDADPEALLERLTRKYEGVERSPDTDGITRVVVRITPERLVRFNV